MNHINRRTALKTLIAGVGAVLAGCAPRQSFETLTAKAPLRITDTEIALPLDAFSPADWAHPSGKTLREIVVKARQPGGQINRPLLAMNDYTLLDAAADREYKAYAIPRVTQQGGAEVMLFRDGNAQTVRQPEGRGPASLGAWGVPWVQQTITMPIYPSPAALLAVVYENRADYFSEIKIKRRAIGEGGTFTFQECLVPLESVRGGNPLSPTITGPVLIHHYRAERSVIEASVSSLRDTATSAGASLRYAGRGVADVFLRTTDGALLEMLQKPFWADATLIFNVPDRAGAEALFASSGYQAFLAAGRDHTAIFYA